MMRIAVLTLFPEMFQALEHGGITSRAMEGGLLELECWNPRDFTMDRHRSVDDRPYGGGPGMVMRVEPLSRAVRAARDALGAGLAEVPRTLYLTPQGRPFTQDMAYRLSARSGMILVCGRYEGVDERFVESEVDEEISLGDFVLSGGELPAMAVVEAVTRLLPGALGCEDSAREDSFSQGLLDCPHYTRPECLEGRRVPPVLLSGDHAAIARWRLKQSLGRTALRRPDLFQDHALGPEERTLLDEFMQDQAHEQQRAEGGK